MKILGFFSSKFILLKKWFKRLSLRRKLIYILAFLFIVALVFILVFIGRREARLTLAGYYSPKTGDWDVEMERLTASQLFPVAYARRSYSYSTTFPRDGTFTIKSNFLLNPLVFSKRFEIFPKVKGKFKWQSLKEVTFIPQEPLAEDTTYTIKVNYIFGLGLNPFYVPRSLTESVHTTKRFRVIAEYPRNNSTNIDINTQIGILLNSVSVEKEEFLKHFSLFSKTEEEEITGDLKVNRNVFIFKPNQPLLYASWYKIKIDKELTSGWGEKLEKDLIFEFKTENNPYVIQISSSGTLYNLSYFDKRVDTFGIYYRKVENPVNFEFYKADIDDLLKFHTYSIQETDYGDRIVEFNKEIELSGLHKLKAWQENLDFSQDKYQNYQINLGHLDPGIYYLSVKDKKDKILANTFIVINKKGLVLKKFSNKWLIWATDLDTSRALDKVSLFFYQTKNKISLVGHGITDNRGLYRIDQKSSPDFVIGEIDGEIIVVPASPEIEQNYFFYFPMTQAGGSYTIYAFTDRPLYQPGDKVNFKGIVRIDNDALYKLPHLGKSLKVNVYHGNRWTEESHKIFSNSYLLDENGTFWGDFDLTQTSSLGDYYFEIEIENERYYPCGFQVEEYRKPEYEISINTDKKEYISKDSIKVDIQVKYFFNKPLANKEISWKVYKDYWREREPEEIAKEKEREYFKSYDWWWERYYESYWGEEISSGLEKLNKEGRVSFEIPSELNKEKRSQNFIIEATIVDETGRTTSEQKRVIIHKGEYNIFSRMKSIANMKEPVEVENKVLDHEGNPLENIVLKAKIKKIEWKKELNEYNQPEWKRYENIISEREIYTDTQGIARLEFIPGIGGGYEVEIQGKDSRDNTIYDTQYIWVLGELKKGEEEYYRENKKEKIKIRADKKEYRPGEVAKITINLPNPGDVLMTLGREKIYDYKVLSLSGKSSILEIPIKEEYIPNIQMNFCLALKDSFEFASQSLIVPASDQKLKVEIDSNKKSFSPGEEVEFTIKTSKDQRPVSANITLSLVDKSLFELVEDITPNIFRYFYHGRYSSTMDYHSLTNIVSLDGGGGFGGGGIPENLRVKLVDTAYWNPNIQTDKNGIAKVKVKLPDNLTTWAAIVKAATQETEVGQTSLDIICTKEVVVRPLLPRFFTVDDKLNLKAVVQNYTDHDDLFKTKLEAEGLDILTPQESEKEISKDGSAEFDWQVKVKPGKEAIITISSWGEETKKGDTVRLSLPIEPFGYLKLTSNSGEGNTRLDIEVSKKTERELSKIKLVLTPTLGAFVPQALEYLTGYPYGCTEQTMSRFLPAVIVSQEYNRLGIEKPRTIEELSEMVNEGLSKLYGFQHLDGGWGWWKFDDSSPFLSAYVMFGLTKARKTGYKIDEEMYNRGIEYLKKQIDKDEIDNNTKVYLYYVLAEAKQIDLEKIKDLAKVSTDLENYSKAYLALALHKLGDRIKSEEIINNLIKEASITETTAFWKDKERNYKNLTTDQNTTAVILQAILRIDPENELIPKIVRWLTRTRNDRYWGSTYTTVNVLLALVEYIKQTKEFEANYSYEVHLNGKIIKKGTIDESNVKDEIEPIEISLADLKAEDNILEIIKEGEGKLYYTLVKKEYIKEEKVSSEEKGIKITREYLDLNNKPLGEFKVGDLIKVKLAVEAPSDLYYVIIKDNLPAAFEAVNDEFNNISFEERKGSKLYDGFNYYFSHRDIYDNKVILFTTHISPGKHNFMYLARVTHKGKFKVNPARIELMYVLDIWGRSESRAIEIIK